MENIQGATIQGQGSDVVKEDVCTEICRKHTTEILQYHCMNHETLICDSCKDNDHDKCDKVKSIPNEAKDMRNNKVYLDVYAELQGKKWTANNINKRAEHMKTSIENSSAKTIGNFKRYKKDIVQALDKIEAELEHKAISMKQDELDKINKLLNEVKQPQDTFRDMKETVHKLKSDDQNCSLYTYMVQIKSRLQALDEQMDKLTAELSDMKPLMKFTPNNDILHSLKISDGFGKVTLEHVTLDRLEHLQDIPIKTKEDEEECWITGSVLLPSNTLVLSDFNNKNLKSIDVRHRLVNVILQMKGAPLDIVLIDDNKLAATMPNRKQIAFVNLTTGVERYMDVNGRCYCVDYRDYKLAVSYRGPDKIEVLTLQGTVLYNIPNRWYMFKGHIFNSPRYIAFGHDTNILYVTNRCSKKVICLKLDGSVKASYSDTKLNAPSKVIIDSSGTVYVCTAGPYTVHQLSRDLQKIKVLPSHDDGVSNPFSLCYNETRNELYIGGSANVLNVYKTCT